MPGSCRKRSRGAPPPVPRAIRPPRLLVAANTPFARRSTVTVRWAEPVAIPHTLPDRAQARVHPRRGPTAAPFGLAVVLVVVVDSGVACPGPGRRRASPGL